MTLIHEKVTNAHITRFVILLTGSAAPRGSLPHCTSQGRSGVCIERGGGKILVPVLWVDHAPQNRKWFPIYSVSDDWQ